MAWFECISRKTILSHFTFLRRQFQCDVVVLATRTEIVRFKNINNIYICILLYFVVSIDKQPRNFLFYFLFCDSFFYFLFDAVLYMHTRPNIIVGLKYWMVNWVKLSLKKMAKQNWCTFKVCLFFFNKKMWILFIFFVKLHCKTL